MFRPVVGPGPAEVRVLAVGWMWHVASRKAPPGVVGPMTTACKVAWRHASLRHHTPRRRALPRRSGPPAQAGSQAVSAPRNACRAWADLTDQVGASCPTRRLPSLLRMVCGLKPSRTARRHLASTMSTVLVWVMAGAGGPRLRDAEAHTPSACGHPARDGHVLSSWRSVMTRFAAPGEPGATMSYLPRYDHWIGGAWVPPARGRYFENPTPVRRSVRSPAAPPTTSNTPWTPRTAPHRLGGAPPPPSGLGSSTRSPTGCRRIWKPWPSLRPGRTASRSG